MLHFVQHDSSRGGEAVKAEILQSLRSFRMTEKSKWFRNIFAVKAETLRFAQSDREKYQSDSERPPSSVTFLFDRADRIYKGY